MFGIKLLFACFLFYLFRTFTVPGTSKKDHYIYKINLSGSALQNTSDPNSACYKAAVCQTKPDTDFQRDIGSFDTRTFIVRGTVLLYHSY